MTTAQIRQIFIDYFAKRDHKVMASSPVIPFDDPTLLFTNAGMNQFKRVFTGEEKAPHPRAVTVQKCLRAGGKHNDLENVGFTARHHTFFEMLGNFSFGDYFKEEAIFYAWELLTRELALDPARLYATVYEQDDEAFALWAKIAPQLSQGGRILRFGKKDNYWSMGDVGPCGPCSEIHYDRGERYGKISDGAAVNGETDRFIEIWNLVFMQFNQVAGVSELSPLPKPSVDTGGGLERWACVLQDVQSNYDIDLFRNIIRAIEEITGVHYETNERGASHRVIADHLRALTFCIADGAGVSNEKQGYVLRRILRRAARHGRKLGVTDAFIYRLVPALVAEMGSAYREIAEKQDHIERVIRAEEESFGRTLDTGLALFSKETARLTATGQKTIPGAVVFELYDTHGFPVDLTEVMAQETGFAVDLVGFDQEMDKQKSRARAASQMSAVGGVGSPAQERALKTAVGKNPTQFTRDEFQIDADVIALENVDGNVIAILDRSPFYVESGGQVSDIGELSNGTLVILVRGVHSQSGHILHMGTLTKGATGDIRAGGKLTARIDIPRRKNIERNHTATHLMQAALRKTLGEHVRQSGSLVNDEKLRFDFSHFGALTTEEIITIENMVNAEILKAKPVTTAVMPVEEAKKSGAMALFGEKYGDTVRVVSVGKFSKELCGGTHVANTSEIGPFMISLETAIASGVRRIEAVTGAEAVRKMIEQKALLGDISRTLKAPEAALSDMVRKLQEQSAEYQKEIKKLKSAKFASSTENIGAVKNIKGVEFLTHNFGNADKDEIAGWLDNVKSKSAPTIAAALGIVEGKPVFCSSANASAIAKGAHAGNVAKELFAAFGGRGGGRDSLAQGAAPDGVPEDEVFAIFEKFLTAAVK